MPGTVELSRFWCVQPLPQALYRWKTALPSIEPVLGLRVMTDWPSWRWLPLFVIGLGQGNALPVLVRLNVDQVEARWGGAGIWCSQRHLANQYCGVGGVDRRLVLHASAGGRERPQHAGQPRCDGGTHRRALGVRVSLEQQDTTGARLAAEPRGVGGNDWSEFFAPIAEL